MGILLWSNTIGFRFLARPMMPSKPMNTPSSHFQLPWKLLPSPRFEVTFFDWRYHFQMEASSTTNDEKFLKHVVLNEYNVLDCFFDWKVDKNVFGHDQFSPIYRYLESRKQNNQCPVKSIISMFEKRTFPNQHEDTAENRAIIKIKIFWLYPRGKLEFC